MGKGKRFTLTRGRPVRALVALTLTLAVAATGQVAWSTPATAAPTTITSPLSPGGATPTWTFDAAAGPGWECSVDAFATPPAGWTDCSTSTSTGTYTSPTLAPDGDYGFSVRQVVATVPGEVSTSAVYTVDTTATGTVTPTRSPYNDPRPTWAIGVESGGAAYCSLVDAATAAAAATAATAGALCSTGFRAADALGEGLHTLYVSFTDALGNTGATTSTTMVDLTPPATPAPAGAPVLSNNATVSWSWTADPTDTAACTLTGPSPVGPVTCTTSTTFSTTVVAEGAYTLKVVLTDAATNVGGPGTSATFTYDRTPPPAPAFLSGPAATGTNRNPTWTFTTLGTTTTCRLSGTTQGSIDLGSCQSGSAQGTNLADDGWTLTVTTSDAAGNSNAASRTYLLDTTGPDAPVVARPAAPLGNNSRPQFTWAGEMPSTAECREVKTTSTGTVTFGSWRDCSATYFDLVLTADADYQVEARLTDPLGNLGATGISQAYRYDGTAPATPLITGAPLVGSDRAPVFTFAVESGGGATCRFQGASGWSSSTDCGGGSYAPPLPGDGDFLVEVVTRDEAGNTSAAGTRSYLLDSTAPGAAAITAPSSPGRDRRPSWGIVGDGSSTLTCQLLGTIPPTGSASCTSGYLGNLDGQADGTYTLEVTATDGAGNTTVVTSGYELDTTAPNQPVVTGPVSPGNAFAPSWTFPVQPRTTANCRLVQGLSLGSWVSCNDGTVTFSGLSDGTYTVEVLVTDLAANQAALAGSPPYTSDRSVPAAPSVGGPSGPGSASSVTWTWSGEAGVTATCRLDRAGVIGSAVSCDGGSFSPALTGDTTYVVVVQLTDAAGNTSSPTPSPTYTLDTGRPAQPVVSGASGIGNTPNPVWTFTSEADAQVTCSLVRDGTPGAWASCSSGQPRTLSGDATYVLHVRVTDAAGNTSDVGVSPSYTYDGTTPGAPIVTAPPSPSATLTPSWGFVAEPGAAAECRLLGAGALVRDWTGCSSPTTTNLTGLPDAEYVVEVRVTDAGGNVSPAGASLPYVLDTTAPNPPTVTGPAGPSTNRTPTFTWTGETGTAATCRLVLDGVVQGSSSCATPFSPLLPVDGQWSLLVSLADASGNVSATPGPSGTYVLDTVAPSTPTVTPPPSPGRDTAPSWSALVETGATTECHLSRETTVMFDWTSCRLPITTDLSSGPDGTYQLAVRATDLAGQTGPVGAGSYLLDTAAPAPPVFTTVPTSPSRNRTATFGFTSAAGSTLSCRLTRGATVVSPATPCTSPLQVSFTGLVDGAYTLSVHAIDAAGNAGAVQTAVYVLDTAPPAAPALVTGPASPSPDRRPSWSFTSEAGATVTCRLTGAVSGVVLPDRTCVSPFEADLTAAAEDTYVLAVRVTDAAGNTGPALSSGYVLDFSARPTPHVVGPVSPGRELIPVWQVSSPVGKVQCRLLKVALVIRDWTTCGPTFSFNLSTSGDGSYAMSARVVDAAGLFSAEVTSRYLLDTTLLAAAVLTHPASPSTDRSPIWTIASLDPGVTAQCQVIDPNRDVARPWAPCAVSTSGSQFTLDLTAAQDGLWTLVVRLTDTAGNVGVDARGTYVLDTSAPQPVLVVAPVSPSFLEKPTWQLTGDSDAILECRLSGPGLVVVTFAKCASVPGVPGAGLFTADLTARDDGTYTLAVRSRDLAGNLGPETTSGYEVERVDPAAPTVPVAPPSPSEVSGISWNFTLEAGSTGLCTLSSATRVVEPEQPCDSPWATDLSLYGIDGTYGLSVRAVDAAGNLSPAVVAWYVLDRTAPDAPSIVGSPGSPAPSLAPAWRLEPSAAGDTLECRLLGLSSVSWGPCGNRASFDLAPATSGTFRLQVREIDPAGNVSPLASSADYVLDLTAPFTPEVAPPSPQRDNSLAPLFVINRQREDVETDHLLCTVRRFDGGTSVASPCAFGPSSVDLTRTPALNGSGDVLLGVRSVDVRGRVSAEATATYAFDNTPPTAPSMLPLTDVADFAATVQWTFAGVASTDTFLCRLTRRGATASVPSSCLSPQTVTLKETGEYTLSVWAVDLAGNVSVTPATSTYTYLAPVPAVGPPLGPTAGADATPTWTFSVPRGYQATCSLSGPGATSVDSRACGTGTYTGPLTGLAGGTYSLSILLADGFGNLSDLVTRATYHFAPRAALDGHLGQTGPLATPPQRPDVRGAVAQPRPTPPSPLAVTPTTGTWPGPTRAGQVVPTRLRVKTQAVSPLTVAPALREVPRLFGEALSGLGRKPTIPLLLLSVVVGFLLLQNQIDRRDPKLASAPVGAEPELDFGPVLRSGFPRSRNLEGGAPA